jgi:HEPN domain-containing protein
MPEYDFAFAKKLAAVADKVDEEDSRSYAACRVTVYLSRLSVEIALKALLERAGVPIEDIRARSHDLRGLLADLGKCEVEIDIAPWGKHWVSAARVRARTLDLGAAHVPIGDLIDAEDVGASRYPNQIRYGSTVVDFTPGLLAGMALELCAWAEEHWNCIRRGSAD